MTTSNPARPGSRAMTVARLQAYCLGFEGATGTAYGEPYNFLVYTVGGNKFAYFKTSEPEKWRFSVRVDPDRFVELTDMPGVKPARWRGRYGWITIVEVRRFPADYLRELVAASWRRALLALPKARQAEMLVQRGRVPDSESSSEVGPAGR